MGGAGVWDLWQTRLWGQKGQDEAEAGNSTHRDHCTLKDALLRGRLLGCRMGGDNRKKLSAKQLAFLLADSPDFQKIVRVLGALQTELFKRPVPEQSVRRNA